MSDPAPTQTNPVVGWRSFLAALPVRNEAAREENLVSGLLPINVKVKRPRWLVPPISWVMPFSNRRTVKLDELGQFLWRACNGKARVEDIVVQLSNQERLTFHEARIAVTQHLEELVRRGIIVLVVQEEAQTQA